MMLPMVPRIVLLNNEKIITSGRDVVSTVSTNYDRRD